MLLFILNNFGWKPALHDLCASKFATRVIRGNAEIAANGIPAAAVTDGGSSLKYISKCVIRVKDAVFCDGL